jgi:hypothetical protein
LNDGKTGLPVWLAGLCIAMLLLSTTAQAVHFCELSVPGELTVVQSRQASPNSAICLICLMAHSAAAAVLVVVLSPTFFKRVRVSVPQGQPQPVPRILSVVCSTPSGHLVARAGNVNSSFVPETIYFLGE